MKKIKLFTDSSLNPQEKIGFGAYLLLDDENESFEELKEHIKIKRFENTSSTKLELQTLLWALEELKEITDKNAIIEVYTDCQNIIGLQNRRDKLEKNHFYTSSRELINNHELYKDFYKKLDELRLVFIKVKGHKKSSLKDEIDTIFNLVDKASRKALRKNNMLI